jgi:hypothetical protein
MQLSVGVSDSVCTTTHNNGELSSSAFGNKFFLPADWLDCIKTVVDAVSCTCSYYMYITWPGR